MGIHKKNMFEEGKQKKSFAEQLLATKVKESEDLAKQLLVAMQEVKENQAKLEQIALKPKPFTDLEYFEQMIKQEEDEKKPGWKERQAHLEAARDEVVALNKYSTVENLNELFPQYQAEIRAAVQKKGRTPTNSDKQNCVL